MAELGRAALVVSLGLSVYALVAGIAAARLGRRRLAFSAQNALVAAFASTLIASAVLLSALPPLLYLGYVGLTVPFAFAIGALIAGRTDERWLIATRRWTLFAWTALGI